MDLLANYEFTVIYRPGPKHGNADALSGIEHASQEVEPFEEAGICVLGQGWACSAEDFCATQRRDEDLAKVHEWIRDHSAPQSQEVRELSSTGKLYAGILQQMVVNDKGLRCRRAPAGNDIEARLQVCIPSEAIGAMIEHAHKLAGHKAAVPTLERLRRNKFFFSPAHEKGERSNDKGTHVYRPKKDVRGKG